MPALLRLLAQEQAVFDIRISTCTMKISFVPGKMSDNYCYKHVIFMENTKEEGVLEILHRLKQIQVLDLTFLLIRNSLLCYKQI